jgi:hypothetical protein
MQLGSFLFADSHAQVLHRAPPMPLEPLGRLLLLMGTIVVDNTFLAF